MKKSKRILAAVLAAVVSLGVLSSCGKKEVKPISEDGLELTVFMHFMNYTVYNDEWPIFKKAAELTGVTLKGTASETVSDSSQAFNTMLASTTLPDIIHSSFTNLNEIGKDGALIPLEDLIDEYAPHIKEMFEKYPQLRKRATADDGHIYYIPGSLSGMDAGALPSLGWFIRQDWLDKLGLEQPKTIEELEKVWTAFRNQDPNGNGIKDEVPFFSRVGGLSSLFWLFRTYESGYVLDEKTGKIVYAPITPEFKTAVKKIAEWYKNGLIDEEIFTRGGQCREQLLGGNLGGSTHDWFSSTASYSARYADSVPGINFIPMAPPAGIDGKIIEGDARTPIHSYGWGISKDNKYPEETMKYFDFWYTEEGSDLISFGVEGIHYNVVDGKKVFTDEVLNAEEGVPTYMRGQGQVETGVIRKFDAEYQGMTKEAQKGWDMYNDNKWCKKQTEFDVLNEEEIAIKEKYNSNINTFASEQRQKWIMGADDVDATWDKYVETIKSMHVDDMIKVNQAAYDRLNK